MHTGTAFGISESQCLRITRDIEELLVRNGAFSLPGKKALGESGTNWELVIVDASKTPAERPKKTAPLLFRQEKGE